MLEVGNQILKVGQVWRNEPTRDEYRIVGIHNKMYDLFHLKDKICYCAFDLERYLDDYTKISEWDGKLRHGQRWEHRDGDTWVPFTLDMNSPITHLVGHINNPNPNFRYLGEAEEPQEEVKEDRAYLADVDQIIDEISCLVGIPKGYIIDTDKLKTTGENSMKLKITEVKLNELTQTTIRTKAGIIANTLGYSSDQIDGKIYFREPGKYVGEFEATPEKLTEIFRDKILAGDQAVTDFLIETGILAGGSFVTE